MPNLVFSQIYSVNNEMANLMKAAESEIKPINKGTSLSWKWEMSMSAYPAVSVYQNSFYEFDNT